MGGNVGDRIGRLPAVGAHGETVHTTIDRFERDLLQREVEFLGDGVTEIDQHARPQPGCPDLQGEVLGTHFTCQYAYLNPPCKIPTYHGNRLLHMTALKCGEIEQFGRSGPKP
ncbi:MAG TPA: hypothetical protein VMW65_04140 [Chloroflexota bacterium]|nr:hypothetical protein [Chloroflexota bacterium]